MSKQRAIAMADLMGQLAIRQVFWVAGSGLGLGMVWGGIALLLRPPDSLLDWTLALLFFLPGLVVISGLGGLLVGLATGLLHVLVAALPRIERHVSLYRRAMPSAAAVVGLIVARYALAVWSYWAGDFNWDLGWNREDFPTLSSFLALVVVPTLLAVVGTWWATGRVAAWYVRVLGAEPGLSGSSV